VSGRADVYSLGCLLYECLTGAPPYVHASEAAVLFAHLREEPPTLPGLEQVLAKALAKSPQDRYASCRELAEGALAALGVAAPHRSRWPLVIAGVAAAAVIGAALLAFGLERGGSVATPRVNGNAVAVIDPGSNRVVEQVPVGASPEGIAFTDGSLWVSNLGDQ